RQQIDYAVVRQVFTLKDDQQTKTEYNIVGPPPPPRGQSPNSAPDLPAPITSLPPLRTLNVTPPPKKDTILCRAILTNNGEGPLTEFAVEVPLTSTAKRSTGWAKKVKIKRSELNGESFENGLPTGWCL